MKFPTWYVQYLMFRRKMRCRKVVCVDTEVDFTSSAKRFDQDLAKAVAKKGDADDADEPSAGATLGNSGKNAVRLGNPPRHVTFRLEPSMDIGELESRERGRHGSWVDYFTCICTGSPAYTDSARMAIKCHCLAIY